LRGRQRTALADMPTLMLLPVVAVVSKIPVMYRQANEGGRTQKNEHFGNIQVSHYYPPAWIICPYRMAGGTAPKDSVRKI
jgi:hypothetical protein